MKYIYTICFLLLIGSTNSFAQDLKFGFDYRMAAPLAEQGDYISKTSFSGAGFYMISEKTENLSFTFDIGYNFFYEKENKNTYEFGTISLTGVQYRYITTVPITAGVNYTFMPESSIKPYIGLGAGFVYNQLRLDMGLYNIQDEIWKFMVKPEVGILFALNPNFDLKFSSNYNKSVFNSDEYPVTYLNYNIGFVSRIH